MQKNYGKKLAHKLRQRLMELKAASNLSEISYLPPARCHPLAGKREGQFSVDLEHPYRLIFIPGEQPIPLREEGGIDLEKIKSIVVMEIADTH